MISIILDNHNEISINVAEETDEENEDVQKDLSTIAEATSEENGEKSQSIGKPLLLYPFMTDMMRFCRGAIGG